MLEGENIVLQWMFECAFLAFMRNVEILLQIFCIHLFAKEIRNYLLKSCKHSWWLKNGIIQSTGCQFIPIWCVWQDNDCLELKVTWELLIGMPKSLWLANVLALLTRQKLREIIQTINDWKMIVDVNGKGWNMDHEIIIRGMLSYFLLHT